MDREIIEEKLESLRRCLQRISNKCPPHPELLENDPDIQDIIVLNLTRAVQLCVDIGAHYISGMDVPTPETMGETFTILGTAGVIPDSLAMRLKKSVGFRNIAVHNYAKINWVIVHAIARDCLDDFAEFAKIIASGLNSR